MKAILLISHGSHSLKTETEVQGLIRELKSQSDVTIIEYAFLEIAKPSIPEGIDICIQKGATEIVILLNFLNAGKHVDDDIPRIVNEKQKKHPNIKFHITKPLGQHNHVTKLFLDMIENTEF